MGYVRTARAKMAIRRHLRGQRLSRAQEVGHKLFDSNIKRMGLNPDKFMERKAFLKALDTHGLNPERFYQEIGTRKLNLRSTIRPASAWIWTEPWRHYQTRYGFALSFPIRKG